MSYPGFIAVAGLVGVPLCTDRACQLGDLQRHHTGYVQAGVIHWRDRVPTRRGLWNFLKLVSRARGSDAGLIEQVWLNNITAYEIGVTQLGIRFPRDYADTARAHVRAMLADELWIPDDTRKKIIRWAQE